MAARFMTPIKRNGVIASLVTALAITVPNPAAGQDEPDFTLDGLLRTGLRLESARYDGVKGFDIYDARLGLSGRVGIVFDYALRAEYHFADDAVRLIDARLSLPLRDEILRLDAGLVMAGFGREAMKPKDILSFVERSQGSLALAPGRQVGAALRGAAFEERLHYWGGLYNGEGATFGNEDRKFLYAMRAEYNSVGEIEFFEDFVFEVGANLAFASDSANPVLPVSVSAGDAESPGATVPAFVEYTGDRFAWSADAGIRYRNWSLATEYAKAEYDPTGDAEEVTSEAWFVQGGYTLWGAFDLLARFDSFLPAAGLGVEPDRTEFLVFGFKLNPGFHATIGLQYALGIDDALVGVPRSIDRTNTGPALADKQFMLNLQLAF